MCRQQKTTEGSGAKPGMIGFATGLAMVRTTSRILHQASGSFQADDDGDGNRLPSARAPGRPQAGGSQDPNQRGRSIGHQTADVDYCRTAEA